MIECPAVSAVCSAVSAVCSAVSAVYTAVSAVCSAVSADGTVTWGCAVPAYVLCGLNI